MTHDRSRRRGRRSPDRSPVPSFSPHDPHEEKLASQADEVLRLALASLDDPRFDDVTLRGVRVEPGALRVVLDAPPEALARVEHAIDGVLPFLRRELAAEIHRKRVPLLRVTVLPRVDPEEAP